VGFVEIKGETIRLGVFARLSELFPEAAIYDEAVTDAEYPHFYIYVPNAGLYEDNFGRRFLDFRVSVTYREAMRPETARDIQSRLDELGLTLLEKFDWFERGGKRFRLSGARIEKTDGAMVFLFNVKIRVRKSSPDVEKQMILLEKSELT
jgi:hypothetical protein